MIWLILIVGLGLRLISLNQSLWLDEATSLLTAQNYSFGDIITKFSPGDFHPPFYYLLLKTWTIPFGSSEIAGRLLSVLVGILTILFIYKIGSEAVNRKAGLIAASLLATSGLFVYYSQEARMYALTALLVTMLVFSFVKLIKKGGVGDWAVFSFLLALTAATDYVAILILPALWISAAVSKQNRPWWKRFLASHIILIIFIAFWSPIFIKQLTSGLMVSITSPSWWKILGLTSIKNLALIPTKFILGRISFENKLLYGFIVGLTSLLFGYLVIRSTRLFNKTKVIWFWLIIPIVLSAVIGLKISIFYYFRLLFVLPAFYLLVAIGISKMKKFSNLFLILLLILNTVFTGIYLFTSRFQREDWRGLVKMIESETTKEKSITIFPSGGQMEAYRYYSKLGNYGGPEAINDNYQTIWLMRYVQEVFDPQNLARKKIENLGYQKTKEYDFNGVLVWKYIK
jgi:4-amino-4-deoxy-L-arabinose transferase-like glycosyltransferase